MSDHSAIGRHSERFPVGIVSSSVSPLVTVRSSETSLTTVQDGLFRIRWILHAVLPLFGSDVDLLLEQSGRDVVFAQSRTIVLTLVGDCKT